MRLRFWRKEENKSELFVNGFTSAQNNDGLYIDKYLTLEQQTRDREITKLLKDYVSSYETKMNWIPWYRGILFLVTVAIVVFLVFFFYRQFCADISPENLGLFATASISIIATVIGILGIITKYMFPENDEKYITRIVRAIQENDYKNKALNTSLDTSTANDSSDLLDMK